MTPPLSPRRWETTALRRVATVKTGKTVAPAPSSPSDVEAPYITAAHIQPLGRMIDVDDKVMWFAPHELAALDLREGDLLVVEGGAGYGRPAVVSGDYTGWGFQNHVNRIRTREGLSDTRFLYYVFEHFLASGITAVTGAGATFPTLSAEKVRSMVLAVPPIAEQRGIACFLDRETAQIDAIIAAQQQLATLLEERKTGLLASTLNHVWDSKRQRLKWLYKVSKESNQPNLEVLSVYRDHGVIPKSSRADNFNKTPENLERYLVVRPNDLVVNRMKAWQGSLGVSSHVGIVSGDYEVARPVSSALLPDYAHFVLRSPRLVGEYRARSTGIRPSQWRLYWEQMGLVEVPVPSREIQHELVRAVRGSMERMDSTIDAANESIALMRERRAALISAAVTGRIDPRSGQGTTPDALEAS